MIAALPMYDRPENRAAHDRLWGLIRDHLRAAGIDAPERLDRDLPHDAAWGRDDLVLGQICNLPLRARHATHVTWIATADHDIAGSAPGMYHSVFVVRQDDAAQTLAQAAPGRFAFSDPLSNSGWGAPWQTARAQGLHLNPVLGTGGHAASVAAVAEGRADLAAIDALTWRNLTLWDPLAARVRVIGRTHDSPGMTYITRKGADPAPLRAALTAAIAALVPADRALLALRGIVTLPASAYDLPFPPDPQASAA